MDEYTDIILPKTYTESKGALACSLSHIKAITTAYKNGNKEALIIEDDTSNRYKHKWKESIESIIKNAPEDTECISFLCSNVAVSSNMLKLNTDFDRNTVFHWSTGCYYINKKGMKKIYDKYCKNNKIDISLKLNNYVADGDIIYNNLITYNYKKPTFINELFGSMIGNNKNIEIHSNGFIKTYFNDSYTIMSYVL